MADLVTLAEQKTFLGVSGSSDDSLLQAIVDAIEELLERACGREERPFVAALNGREEMVIGTASDSLFLDYPIASIASIVIGTDPDNPVETLDPSDSTVVLWEAGLTRIRRIDGGSWGCLGAARLVWVTYNTQDDLPKTAALAVKRVVAAVYRQRGAEDVTGERTSTFSRELAHVADGDPIWQLAVAGSRRVHV